MSMWSRWRWSAWHVAARAFSVATRAIPRRRRFGAALALAGPLAVVARRSAHWRALRAGSHRLTTDRDLALYLVLSRMTAGGATFDVPMRVTGADALHAALEDGRGVFVACAHAMLTHLLVRYLHDTARRAPLVVAAVDGVPALGTRAAARTIQPSATVLLRAQRCLSSGGLLCAMIDDAAERRPDASLVFDTGAGAVAAHDGLVRVASRCGAMVVFAFAASDGDGVTLTFEAPQPTDSLSVDETMAAYARFVTERVARSGRREARVAVEKPAAATWPFAPRASSRSTSAAAAGR